MVPAAVFIVVVAGLFFIIAVLVMAVVNLANRPVDPAKPAPPMKIPIISEIKDSKVRKLAEEKVQEFLDAHNEWLYGSKEQQGE